MAHEEFRQNTVHGALSHLVEECGEVLAAAGKSLRFGLDSVNPLLPKEQQETNQDWLLREVHDLELAILKLKNLLVPPREELTSEEVYVLLKIATARWLIPKDSPDLTIANRLLERGLVMLAVRHTSGVMFIATKSGDAVSEQIKAHAV